MGAVRVVLYAEGALDARVEWQWTAPGHDLQEDELGPAHHLVRRAVAWCRGCPPEAVRFDSPIRKPSGRRYRGSDLLDPRLLRRIAATHALAGSALPVVLIDQDGDAGRHALLSASCAAGRWGSRTRRSRPG